jgi:hypothetical protein
VPLRGETASDQENQRSDAWFGPTPGAAAAPSPGLETLAGFELELGLGLEPEVEPEFELEAGAELEPGKRNRAVVPAVAVRSGSAAGSSEIVPPLSLATWATIARPSPEPGSDRAESDR